MIISIDGYSGTGKSSTAKQVAQELGFTYIDSGAMYRAITLYFLQSSIEITNPLSIKKALKDIHLSFTYNEISKKEEIYLNGVNIENEIRKPLIAQYVSQVSAIPSVREFLVKIQREMSQGKNVVMEGRDIGTVVFPHADLKFFMTADPIIRAKRRMKELLQKGIVTTETEVLNNLLHRDHVDTTRVDSPLKKGDGAIEIDTTHLTLSEQIEQIVNRAKGLKK